MSDITCELFFSFKSTIDITKQIIKSMRKTIDLIISFTELDSFRKIMTTSDLFDSISETYYGLFLGWDNRVMDICRILQAASFLAAAALVCVIFWRRGERKNGRTYQLLAALLLLTAGGSLFIRTFCNMWFFWQTAAAAGLTAMACGGRAWKRQMEKRRKRREWRVITNV